MNEKLISGTMREQVSVTLIKMHGGDPFKALKYVMESGDFRKVPFPEICKLVVLCYCKDKGIKPHG